MSHDLFAKSLWSQSFLPIKSATIFLHVTIIDVRMDPSHCRSRYHIDGIGPVTAATIGVLLARHRKRVIMERTHDDPALRTLVSVFYTGDIVKHWGRRCQCCPTLRILVTLSYTGDTGFGVLHWWHCPTLVTLSYTDNTGVSVPYCWYWCSVGTCSYSRPTVEFRVHIILEGELNFAIRRRKKRWWLHWRVFHWELMEFETCILLTQAIWKLRSWYFLGKSTILM